MNRSIRNDILLSLAGLVLYIPAIGRYGAKLELLLLLSLAIGLGVERLAARMGRREPQTLGWPVWIILPLVLPPALPVWMMATTCLFTAVITVAFFGGYGRQVVSPVAFGWAFAALSFPRAFGFGWSYPFASAFSGFRHWSAALPLVDHPLGFLATGNPVATSTILSGSFPQPPGNALPILVLCLGILLLILRAISFRTCLGFLGATLILTVALPGFATAPVMQTLLVGDTLLVAFLVLSDTRTCSRTVQGRWITGVVAALVAFLIRHFASVADGSFFAVLFVAVFAPLIDEAFLKINSVTKLSLEPDEHEKEAS
jgi:Na+-translocating ferredoxin:NAD+ oxidoreductase RnfD subunit